MINLEPIDDFFQQMFDQQQAAEEERLSKTPDGFQQIKIDQIMNSHPSKDAFKQKLSGPAMFGDINGEFSYSKNPVNDIQKRQEIYQLQEMKDRVTDNMTPAERRALIPHDDFVREKLKVGSPFKLKDFALPIFTGLLFRKLTKR